PHHANCRFRRGSGSAASAADIDAARPNRDGDVRRKREARMATREAISFCRICMGHCGVVLTLDDSDHLVGIRADREDPHTLGYACFKGLQAVEAHNSPERITRPLKRMADGSFAPISLEQALDEIAAKIRTILDEDGPEAIAGYKGGGAYFTASAVLML